MTRTVRDAAHLLNTMARRDPADAATGGAPAPVDYVNALRPHLQDLRVGVVRDKTSDEVRSLFEEALGALRDLGATLVEVALPPVDDKRLADEMELILTEMNEQVPRYLASRRPAAAVKTLADIVEANRRNGSGEMSALMDASVKGPTSGEAYRQAFARSRLNARDHGIDGAANRYSLDALVGLSIGPAWKIAADSTVEFDEPRGILLTSGAGYPSVTVPMGDVGLLPIGMLFFGTAWTESTLLRCAFAYEQRTHHRRRPPS